LSARAKSIRGTANVSTRAARKKPRERPRPEPVARCIGCGCDDNNACLAFGEEPCSWISVNRARGAGICSECVIRMFNALLFPEESDVEIHRSIMAEVRS